MLRGYLPFSFLCALTLGAQTQVVVEQTSAEKASRSFAFSKIPAPVRGDAAESARVTLVSGETDPNSGGLRRLTDGRLPGEEDEPSANFFLKAGGGGGLVLIDLGKSISIRQINSYSWHPGGRAAQYYRLLAFAGDENKFQPPTVSEVLSNGWKELAQVDSRLKEPSNGGQHGVSIVGSNGPLGAFRYLALQIENTQKEDRFAQTFFSEVDVIEADQKAVLPLASIPSTNATGKHFSTQGRYHFYLETEAAPDLSEWAEKSIMPVVLEWYPKLVKMLPSDGFEAPTNVTIRFRDNMGGTPASAGGGRINCNADWFRKNQKGEAVGSVVHEMVHIVQQYGRARRTNPNPTRTPGWLVEGIPDYIRWFLYEPQTKGAEITSRNLARAKYDASYRITGNFLDWATRKHDRDLVRKLNAAAREGKYQEDLWKELTGKTLPELGEEWRKEHEIRLSPAPPKEN